MTVSGVVTASALANTKVTTQVGSAASADDKTPATSAFNGWTTSQISFAGVEDLGGGLKASFTINTGIASSPIGNRDTFLALEGGFGKVQAGQFIAASTMGYHALSGAASTANGSLYSIGAVAAATNERFSAVGVTGAATTTAALTGGTFERNPNQLQYTSPSFSGLTLNVNYGNNTTADKSNLLSEASTKTQGMGATYANGPLTVAMGTNTRDIKAEGASNTATGAAVKAKLNWVGASYLLGDVKLSATQVTRTDTSTAAGTGVETENADIKATGFGASMPMGMFTFAASTYTGKSKGLVATTDDQKIKGHQLSVQYALSKRSTLYALNGVTDRKNEGTNTTGTARKESLTMVGLTHAF